MSAASPSFGSTDPQASLRGGRFAPVDLGALTPAQAAMVANVMNSPRGGRTGLSGPFNVLLRSPEVGDLIQKVGGQLRFHSSLPAALKELAILMVARTWTSQFEWYAHAIFAREAGLSDAVIDAVAAGTKPAQMTADEAAIHAFCSELLETKHVSDTTFASVKERFGETGIVDLIATVGYYHIVSMVLNVDRYPLPAGVEPPLQPLDRRP